MMQKGQAGQGTQDVNIGVAGRIAKRIKTPQIKTP